MDKFKVGDPIYWINADGEDSVEIGRVIDYNPEGFGWLKMVKYQAAFTGENASHFVYLGNERSPDVWGSVVMTKDEYEKSVAKREYEELLDHGNGD